ncbi:MAG: transposase, partial [Acidimicrobiia bacterium]
MERSGHEQLERFRVGLYGCLRAWPDALFELADAALCAPGPLHSVPALSLEPEFRRSHGSLYKALADGDIDTGRLDRLLVEHRPTGWPNVFAVDATTWDRCDAETSPERGFYYSASKHSAGQPIVAGWCYQWICQLNWAPDSWTAPLDVRRVPPTTDMTTATVDQVRRLVERLDDTSEAPLFVFDAGYDPIALGYELADTACEVLCRIRDDRVFHTDPPPRTSSTMGRPSRHGTRFKCSDPQSWPEPAATLIDNDSRYGTVTVNAWHDLHPKLARRGHWTNLAEPPIVRGSVIRVEVEHLPKPTARTKKTLWLWWSGADQPDLDKCWRAYLRRFDIEHTFRFAKNTLGWTAPSI